MIKRFLLVVFGLLLVFIFVSSITVLLYNREVAAVVEPIIPDLSSDLVGQSFFVAEKRLNLLKRFGFNGLVLFSNYDKSLVRSQSSCVKQTEFPIEVDGLVIGTVLDCATVHTFFSFAIRSPMILLIMLGSVVLALGSYFLSLITYKAKINNFILESKKNKNLDISTYKDDSVIAEIYEIIKSLSATKYALESARIQKEQQDIFAQLAKQVAHDIRSPLSAMSMVLSGIEFDIERKELIQDSLKRINDIAKDLLDVAKNNSNSNSTRDLQLERSLVMSRVVVSSFIKSILREKKNEYLNIKNVDIQYESELDERVEVEISKVEIARVLSNVLNNAFEALDQSVGVIRINLIDKGMFVVIRVVDTGVGMSPETIERIGKGPFTHGKISGNGLGISHAIKVVEGHRGKFLVTSKVGVGTEVSIELPKKNQNEV